MNVPNGFQRITLDNGLKALRCKGGNFAISKSLSPRGKEWSLWHAPSTSKSPYKQQTSIFEEVATIMKGAPLGYRKPMLDVARSLTNEFKGQKAWDVFAIKHTQYAYVRSTFSNKDFWNDVRKDVHKESVDFSNPFH